MSGYGSLPPTSVVPSELQAESAQMSVDALKMFLSAGNTHLLNALRDMIAPQDTQQPVFNTPTWFLVRKRTETSPLFEASSDVHCISHIVEKAFKSFYIQEDVLETLKLASHAFDALLQQISGLVYEATAVKLLVTPDYRKYATFIAPTGDPPFSLPFQSLPKLQCIPQLNDTGSIMLNEQQLYVPEPGYPTVDAFIRGANEMILLQVAIANAHTVKPEGIQRLLASVSTHVTKMRWCFIFVVPSDEDGQRLLARELRGSQHYSVGERSIDMKCRYVVFGLNAAKHKSNLDHFARHLIQTTSDTVSMG